MSKQPPAPHSPPPAPPSPAPGSAADPRAQRHRAFLDAQLEIGAKLLRLVDQEATDRAEALSLARPTSGELSKLAEGFDRISRTMRRAILLHRMLDEPVTAKPVRSPTQQRTDARKSIIRQVEDIIHDTADDGDIKALRAELYVRLDTPDLEDEIQHRPVDDIIVELCTDLGLDEMDGKNATRRRTPDDVARLCARAAAPPGAQSTGHSRDGAGRPGPS